MDPSSTSPASAPSIPALPALDNTMGAWLLGTFFGVLLQGVAYHQTYRYFRLFPNDPRSLKTWVAILQFMETANTVLSMHTCYYNLITNYFNPAILVAGPVWSLKFLPVPGCLTAVITQLFFARRVYMIERRFRPVAFIATVLIIGFAACYITFTGIGWNAPTINLFLKFSWLPTLGSALIMAADLILTAVLIYFLRRNRTGVTRTDSMLDILIMYAVSSGLIICIFNILNVITSLVWPDNLIFTGISIVLTKLYSNTFLVSLNARQSLVNRGVVMEDTTPFRSTIVGKRTPRMSSSATKKSISRRVDMVPLEIHRNVSTIAVSDSATAVELKDVSNGLTVFDSIGTLDKRRDEESLRDDGDAV